ncbi:MAG: hypothetical protein ACRCX8_05785 [Sarcina sp.]
MDSRLQIAVTFKKTLKERELYAWLRDKSSPANFLKDIAYMEMLKERDQIVFKEVGEAQVRKIKRKEVNKEIEMPADDVMDLDI